MTQATCHSGHGSPFTVEIWSMCVVGIVWQCNWVLQVLEIPIVTYKRLPNGHMELDESIQSKEEEEICKNAISKHSPLRNDLSIGVQFAKIESKGKTGTRIFVYNLDQWEGECIFACTSNHKEGTGPLVTRRQELKDLQIRSQRVRARSGQTSLQVVSVFLLLTL